MSNTHTDSSQARAKMEEPQEAAPVTGKPRPVDEEKKMLEELRLMPSEWEQNLFERWWLPVAMLIPIGVLFLLGLSQDIYLYLNYWQRNNIPFHLEYTLDAFDVIYVSFAVMFMAIVWLHRRFLRLAPSALRGLWDNGLLSSRPKTETPDGTSPAAKFLRRYKAALKRRLRFVLLGVGMIVTGVILGNYIARSFTLPFESFLSRTDTLFIVLKWFVFPQFWIWVGLTAAWPMLVTAYYLRRLSEDLDLEVIPSHPDQCGGLKPIGDICLQLAMIALVASLVLGYWGAVGKTLRALGVLPSGAREGKPITQMAASAGTLGGIIGGTWLFFYPVLGIRGDMKKKKAEFAQKLAEVAAEFDREFGEAIIARDGAQIKDAYGKLETLQSTYSLLKGYPEWPIRRRIFLRFLTPQFFSVLGLFINLNTDKVQRILKSLVSPAGG